MKKLIAAILVLTLALAVAGCAGTPNTTDPVGTTTVPADTKGEGVMTYDEYIAAADQTMVTIEAYVQATQSWWDNKITIYAQDADGGYFLYNMVCSEADAAKLTKGTKIRATGSKTTWSGEVEIMEGTLEILEGNWVAEVTDVTSLLASEDLVKNQNKFVSFKGMTVEACNDAGDAFQYNWDGSGAEGSDSDLYFKASVDGKTYTFVIEYYLTGPDSDAYKAVQNLKVGDKIDMEGFLYWYEGVNPHITAVTPAA